MKRLVALLCCAASLAWAAAGDAQPPTLKYTAPQAVAPAGVQELRLFGDHLAGATGLWTSFPATVEAVPDVESSATDASPVEYRLTLAEDVAVGIGAVRVATGQGVSSLRLLMIDDLPSAVEQGENNAATAAQELALPVAVDGHCDAQKFDYYTFRAVAGQRLSVEVVARRLGFPLDPVVRLLDAAGRELAYSDDEPGIGADARFAYQFTANGQYTIEIRDIRYQGGQEYRYRLRLGDFPLATVAFPLGVQRGESCQVSLAGTAIEQVAPLSVSAATNESGIFSVAAQYPDGQGSGFVTMVAGDLPEKVEFEPNDTIESATPLELPGAINGRFHGEGDRDHFQFTARAGQRLIFTGLTRSLGSPSDLFMRLYRADGAKLAEAEDADKQEGIINHKFDADGVYRLMVEDLHRRGGPEHAYRVEVSPYQPGFTLAAETEKVDVPCGGVFTAKITAGRRDYNGPIRLAVEGCEGIQLAGNTIDEGKNETVLRATVPAHLEPGTFDSIRIVGRATINDQEHTAVATTMGPLRQALAGLPYPPGALDGVIGLGIGPVFPDFFKLAGPSDPVSYPRLVGNTTFAVNAERLNKFDGPVTLSLDSLPAGFTAEAKPIEQGQAEATITLTGPALLGGQTHTLRVVGSAVFQNQPKRVVLADISLRAVDPLEVSLVPAGPIVPGQTQRVKVKITRHGGEPAAVQLSLTNLPDGVTAPEKLEIAADQHELEVPITAAADMAAMTVAEVVVVATTRVKDQAVVVASAPTMLSIERSQE